VGPSSGHGRAAAAGPGGRLPRPVLLHGRRLLLRHGRGGRPRRGGPALLPRAQPRRSGRRGFREREARGGRQGGESPSLVGTQSSPLSPFVAFAFAPTKLARVRCVLSFSLASAGSGGGAAPRAFPAGIRRWCAAAPPPPQPAYPGTMHAAAEVWKSCVFSWLIGDFSPA
jgi:hypothetical protein